MAIAILENCIKQRKAGYVAVRHDTHHDLESLIWVAEYALFHRAYQAVLKLPKNDAKRQEIATLFQKEFGHLNSSFASRFR